MNRLARYLMILSQCWFIFSATGQEINVRGTVTDGSMNALPGALIIFTVNAIEYSASSGIDGSYSILIDGLYPIKPDLFEVKNPFPNPFSRSVKIPVIISEDGELFFSVYDLAGRKITELEFPSLTAGAYNIIWDGCKVNGSPVTAGYYIYAITFKGITISGRLIKTPGVELFSYPSGIEITMPADDPAIVQNGYRIPVIASGQKDGYYTVRFTDITLLVDDETVKQDTVIDFILLPVIDQPFKTTDTSIARYTGQTYESMILKGVNLGSSPPGYFPGEIAYAISPDMYERWIELMAETGFNALRVYTLHPPVFYEKLAEYNYRHSADPIWLFQGVWLDEVEISSLSSEYDLMARSDAFTASIREVIDCMHGNRNISFRPGRAYGKYITDISPWIAGYIIGREISPQEVDSTNHFHPDISSYMGNNFSIGNASATEVFVTEMLDETCRYEWENWGVKRTVSMSSWPTLDPLIHPTEIYTDEDIASFDITKIVEMDANKSLFASYHAYPYYPDFVNDDPGYQAFSDEVGRNSYLGYLTALKNHYSHIPLVIAEFGVPSSWGSAHESFSGMPHGGLSEEQQGSDNIRIMKNLLSSGCAGGFMFAWMDEWFKPTWIVQYLEAYFTVNDGINIPTRQLWHNLLSPEQNFGLIDFEQTSAEPWYTYSNDGNSVSVTSIKASHDNRFFYLDIGLKSTPADGDSIMIAFDTYLKDTGESILFNGKRISNRAEFLLVAVKGQDTAGYYVTEAYDMHGLSPKFNFTDPETQMFKSIVSDGAAWNLMTWITNGFSGAEFKVGEVPAENSSVFTPGKRTAVAWEDDRLQVRVPWTMLYFYDPTQVKVIDGAISHDGGYSFEIISRISDGIAVSVYNDSMVTNALNRYTWSSWLVVPPTTERAKTSLEWIREGLSGISDYRN